MEVGASLQKNQDGSYTDDFAARRRVQMGDTLLSNRQRRRRGRRVRQSHEIHAAHGKGSGGAGYNLPAAPPFPLQCTLRPKEFLGEHLSVTCTKLWAFSQKFLQEKDPCPHPAEEKKPTKVWLSGPISCDIAMPSLRYTISHRPLNGFFRGAVVCHGWGARKQPIKQPTAMPTSPMALMGRFPSLMGRFPTSMGRFTDFVLRGRFTF